MTAIGNDISDGGKGLTPENPSDGSLNLKAVLNGLAHNCNALKGADVGTITSPMGTAVPALTASSNLGAYATSSAPTGSENDADRAQMNAMRADIVMLRDYMVAARTEITALRAFQHTRYGLTLRVTPSADYT